jgi:hypothetical protein
MKKKNKKQPQMKPILDLCMKTTIEAFGNIDKIDAASDRVFEVYSQQLEDAKLLPFSEAERDLMRNTFRVAFTAGVTAATFALDKEMRAQNEIADFIRMKRSGGC